MTEAVLLNEVCHVSLIVCANLVHKPVVLEVLRVIGTLRMTRVKVKNFALDCNLGEENSAGHISVYIEPVSERLKI